LRDGKDPESFGLRFLCCMQRGSHRRDPSTTPDVNISGYVDDTNTKGKFWDFIAAYDHLKDNLEKKLNQQYVRFFMRILVQLRIAPGLLVLMGVCYLATIQTPRLAGRQPWQYSHGPCRSIQLHVACFLGAIIEAHALLGYKHVDVHWLESFRRNPVEHISNITRFFGLVPMPPGSLPQSESALTAVIKSTSGSASTFFRNAWQSKPGELSGNRIGGTLPSVIDDDIKERLRLFFEPFERARQAYFAWAACQRYPGAQGVV